MTAEQDTTDSATDVYPLVAYETFVPHGVLCGLTIHCLESPTQVLAGEHLSVPLIMRPEMARELAAALVRAADEAERVPDVKSAH